MSRILAELSWPVLTDRLTLRPAVAEDAALVWQFQRLPEVTWWMTSRSDDQAAHAERFVANLDSIPVPEIDGRVVGSAKIAVSDAWAQSEVAEQARASEAEIGWMLDPAIQGRGLGTELAKGLLAIGFDGLGLRRIFAQCFADNVRSWKVMEKAGMRREAYHRADSLHRSEGWCDGLVYGLLAEEWREQQAD